MGIFGFGFGVAGEGYFCIFSFNSWENVNEVMKWIIEKFKV